MCVTVWILINTEFSNMVLVYLQGSREMDVAREDRALIGHFGAEPPFQRQEFVVVT
jgi:hypothetical protein